MFHKSPILEIRQRYAHSERSSISFFIFTYIFTSFFRFLSSNVLLSTFFVFLHTTSSQTPVACLWPVCLTQNWLTMSCQLLIAEQKPSACSPDNKRSRTGGKVLGHGMTGQPPNRRPADICHCSKWSRLGQFAMEDECCTARSVNPV